MISVKISARGGSTAPDLSQFLGTADNSVLDCQLHVNDPSVTEADFWFVSEDINDDDRKCQVPRSRVFFVSSEVSLPPGYYTEDANRSAFLDQFARVFTCHDVYKPHVEFTLPFLPWMINANHGSSITASHERGVEFLAGIQSLPKPRKLSVFCSTQQLTDEHRMRLRFVEQLKSHFGTELDWYGNGINSIPEKWDGLAPYAYTIVLENRSDTNVITEKLFDAFLALSYPLYWGAPNAADYFDPASFASIDIRDLHGSVARIEEIIASDVNVQALPMLRASRDKVLSDFNVYRRYAQIASTDVRNRGALDSDDVQLWPIDPFQATPAWSLGRARRMLTRLRPREIKS